MNHRAPHRRRHPITWIVLGTAALITLDVGAWIAWALVHIVFTLAPALLLGLALWWAWRRRRGITPPRPPRVVRGTVVPPAGQLAAVIAERHELRRQVAQLEADAARHDQLVGDLEDAAGRPIEAVIASYRRVQRQYGNAAVGNPGRRP